MKSVLRNLPTKMVKGFASVILGLGLVAFLLWPMAHTSHVARASSTVVYVANSGNDGNGCVDPASPCATIQTAVDKAQAGDSIYIATGIYTGVQAREGMTQVVYISKTVALIGGYSLGFTTTNPVSYPTVIEALNLGRTFVITGAQNVRVENLTIKSGNATWSEGTPLIFAVRGGRGGGVYVFGSTATLNNLQVTNNVGSTNNYGEGGGLAFVSSAVTLTNSLVRENLAKAQAPAGAPPDAKLKLGYGGGLYARGGSVVLAGNQIEHNYCTEDLINNNSLGGGIALFNITATLRGNILQDNICSMVYSRGGGLYAESSWITLTDNTVRNNGATGRFPGWIVGGDGGEGRGGGLYLKDSYSTLDRNIVETNYGTRDFAYAIAWGGGLAISGGEAILTSNIISGNTAALGETGSGWGGGVYALNASIMLTTNFLQNNRVGGKFGPGALGGGGYIETYPYSNGPIRIISNTVLNNIAGGGDGSGDGGGLYVAGRDVILTNNTIRGNNANDSGLGRGGGLYLKGTMTINDNILTSNIASQKTTGYGGGLYLLHGHISLARNIVLSNTATLSATAAGYGGGIFADGDDSYPAVGVLTLTNNILAANSATTSGSGLFARYSEVRARHTTIADNSGGDAAVGADTSGTMITLTNTLVANQLAGISSDGVASITADHTLWHNVPVTITGAVTRVVAVNNFNGDPAFVAESGGNYHIGASSAAIDAGVDAHVGDDLDGFLRPLDGNGDGLARPDIGAYEYVPFAPLLFISKLAPTLVVVGTPITYTLTITNIGPVTATNAVVTDAVPTGANYIQGGTQADGIVTWSGLTVAANGGTTQITFVVTATQTITNTAYHVVTSTEGATTSWGAPVTTRVLTPQLLIGKEAPALAMARAPITYTLTITNTGPVTATNVVVTDAVPAGANYIQGGIQAGGIVTWSGLTVAPNGGTTQIAFVVTATQTITNAAYRVVDSTEGATTPWGTPVTTRVDYQVDHRLYLPIITK